MSTAATGRVWRRINRTTRARDYPRDDMEIIGYVKRMAGGTYRWEVWADGIRVELGNQLHQMAALPCCWRAMVRWSAAHRDWGDR